MADLARFIPTVRIEGEIVTEPQRTVVTRVFYSRVLMKVAPFGLVALWLYFHPSIVGNILALLLLLLVIPIFLPRLGGLGSLGGGLFRAGGALLSGVWQILDGIVGPNKGQVPVLVLNVQTLNRPNPSGSSIPDTGTTCPNNACGHNNALDKTFCVSCGTTLRRDRNGAGGGPRRFAVRIEGQIVGGEPHIGHRVSIHAFNNEGNLLFISGKDETTGATILVRRNADTGRQH